MSSNHSTPPQSKANVWRAYNVRHTLAIGVWSLLIFLFFALAIYIGTLGIIGTAAGYDFSDETPLPVWLAIGALIPVLATTWPLQRWLRRQVAHLLAWETSDASSLVTQLTQIEAVQTAEQLMLTLVQQLRHLRSRAVNDLIRRCAPCRCSMGVKRLANCLSRRESWQVCRYNLTTNCLLM
jgi:hypothetical protein